MDQLFALNGFLSIAISAIIIFGDRPLRTVTPWFWLCLFGCLYGVHAWLLVVLCSAPDDYELRWASLALTALAGVSLMEFARTASDLSRRPRRSQWLLVPCAVVAGLGSCWGEDGFYRAVQAALLLPAGLWGAWALRKAGRAGGGLEATWTAAAALALAAIGLLAALRAGLPSLSGFLTLKTALRGDVRLSCMLGLQAVALGVLVLFLWRHAFLPRVVEGPRLLLPRLQELLWIGLLMVFVGGSLATAWTGRSKNRYLRLQLLSHVGTVAASLDPSDVAAVARALGDETLPAYKRLRDQCRTLVDVMEEPCYIYVLGKRTNEIVFYLDTEPTRLASLQATNDTAKPGDIYRDAPADLRRVFSSGAMRVTSRPYTDKWGTYMSAFTPIWDHRPGQSGQLLCVVGFDVDASNWYSRLARPRLAPIAITLLLAGLLGMFLLIRERDENAKGRLVKALADRERAEQELREQERLVSAVAQTSPDFLSVFDLREMRTVYTNRRVADLISLPPGETGSLGKNWLKTLAHPDDQARVREHLEHIKRAVDGEVVGIEYRLRTRDGNYRWFQSRDTVFRRDAEGRVIQCLSVAQDITEIKQAEATRSNLEAQLRQSQKLEAVGQLAAGVAHDFNNLLTVIQGNASLLQETASDEPALFCGQILEAARRAAGLTQQLLLFSRRHAPQRQLLNLGETLSRLSDMLRRLIGEHVRLEWRCAAGLPPVSADPAMIEQLVLNLAVNARDAMPHGGKLTVSVESVSLEASAAQRHPKARPGRFLCLAVSDTGCGIETANLSRIFEPFFTTKELGKGTGLGLATAYGIVEQHQGWIEVATALNQGTTFQVFLPAAEGQPAAPQAVPAPVVHPGRNETILLVEDELAVLSFAERVLRRGGYRVLSATTGAEALELWPLHKDRVELLITDHLMPEGMTGLELATRLKADRPRLKAILTSGYCAEAADINTTANEVLAGFLAKPFTPEELLQAVEDALGVEVPPGPDQPVPPPPGTSPAA